VFFLLSEDWRSKADRQSYEGNYNPDFHRYLPMFWNGSSPNALLRDFSESPEGSESLWSKVLSDMQIARIAQFVVNVKMRCDAC
jgi:hypothetical protein